jgi:hypothetical protein
MAEWRGETEYVALLNTLHSPKTSIINSLAELTLSPSNLKYYKFIVLIIEKFIKKSNENNQLLAAAYLIDAICRLARNKQYISIIQRFEVNLASTIGLIISGLNEKNLDKLAKLLLLWQQKNIFDNNNIQLLQTKLENKLLGNNPEMDKPNYHAKSPEEEKNHPSALPILAVPNHSQQYSQLNVQPLNYPVYNPLPPLPPPPPPPSQHQQQQPVYSNIAVNSADYDYDDDEEISTAKKSLKLFNNTTNNYPNHNYNHVNEQNNNYQNPSYPLVTPNNSLFHPAPVASNQPPTKKSRFGPALGNSSTPTSSSTAPDLDSMRAWKNSNAHNGEKVGLVLLTSSTIPPPNPSLVAAASLVLFVGHGKIPDSLAGATHAELHYYFSQFGAIDKIYPLENNTAHFVQFDNRFAAEQARSNLHEFRLPTVQRQLKVGW